MGKTDDRERRRAELHGSLLNISLTLDNNYLLSKCNFIEYHRLLEASVTLYRIAIGAFHINYRTE